MNPGAMRYAGEIQTPPTTQDTTGQPVGDWTTIARRRLGIEPLTGRERFELQQVHGTVDHRLHLRRYTGLKPQWRIKVGSRRFHIRAALPVGDLTHETHVLAEEIVE